MHVPPLLRPNITRAILVTLVAAWLVAACGTGSRTPDASGPSAAPDAVQVVATTTVLADMVRQVGGTHVDVISLVPPGGEVHTFDPTPSDLVRVADADLIVMNGLGLDEWLGAMARDSGSEATIVELGEDLDGVEYIAGDDHGDEDEDHVGEAVNPHLWLDVSLGMRYAERIGESLAAIHPDDAAVLGAGTEAYVDRLATLDAWARERLATIPEPDRRIVSFHEAFPYFAAAYDLEIVGTVIDAPGQDPSAGEIAALVDAIRASGAKAIFSEAQFSPDLVETVAREAGVPVESNLYSDSVGEPPADTYEGLIRWDVERVVAALAP